MIFLAKLLATFVIAHCVSWISVFVAVSLDSEPPRFVKNIVGGAVWLTGTCAIASLLALVWAF